MTTLQYEKWGLDLLERIKQADEWIDQIEENKGDLTQIELEIFVDKLNSLAEEVEIYKDGIRKTDAPTSVPKQI